MSDHKQTATPELPLPLTLNTEGDPGCSSCARDGVKAWIVTDATGREILNHGHDTTIDYRLFPLIITAANSYEAMREALKPFTALAASIPDNFPDDGVITVYAGTVRRAALALVEGETKE